MRTLDQMERQLDLLQRGITVPINRDTMLLLVRSLRRLIATVDRLAESPEEIPMMFRFELKNALNDLEIR